MKKKKKIKSNSLRILLILIVLLFFGVVIYRVIQAVYAQSADVSAPQKTIVQPPVAADAANVVSGVTTIEANVTDPSGVAKVELRFRDQNDPINVRGTQYVFTATDSPYRFTWDTNNLPDGRQRYDIQAWDTVGNGSNEYLAAGLAAMNNPNYPPIQLLSPISSVSGLVTIEVSTSADNGIAGVYINGPPTSGNWVRINGAPYKYTWDTTRVQDGTYSFRVRSFEHDKFSYGDLGDPGEIQFNLIVAKYGAITGTIYSSTGRLVPGAKITLRVNNKNVTYTSDSQGKYTIPNLTPGTYQITYVAAGYSSQKTTATVTAGQILVIDVTLHPK